ncbi:spore germination protein [Brevibacillus humidisoli]|uniref:GerAB/ArcD/ProY family transporter n=1 Tax=Brevibacillus humidisoli TaxID=2895522 RepID=UPI001E50F27D|nr:GerAB/ArcD/ProY family transporter [Brevibacillus humidisoli]UFJ38940.1 spore germination protein [Brevibacillus humidisoli]
MDKGRFRKLNRYHVIFLVHQSMAGAAVLSLPHALSPVGYNQWWVVLLMGVIAQVTLLPIYWLCIRYPDDDLFAIHRKLLGTWLGQLLNIVLISYLIVSVSAVLMSYVRLVQSVTLPNRSIELPLFALYIVLIYVVLGGIKSIARFSILAFFFVAWTAYYLQWGFFKGTLSHLFPMFGVSYKNILLALDNGYVNMLGYELLLFYFPYIVHQRKTLTDATIGLWSLMLFYWAISFVSVVYFSEWQLEHLTYPILNLFKAVELTFIERIENIGIALWSFLVIATVAVYTWAAKKGVDSLFLGNRTWHLYLVAIVSYALVILPLPTQFKDSLFYEWGADAGYLVILWPIILLVIHYIRKPKGRSI